MFNTQTPLTTPALRQDVDNIKKTRRPPSTHPKIHPHSYALTHSYARCVRCETTTTNHQTLGHIHSLRYAPSGEHDNANSDDGDGRCIIIVSFAAPRTHKAPVYPAHSTQTQAIHITAKAREYAAQISPATQTSVESRKKMCPPTETRLPPRQTSWVRHHNHTTTLIAFGGRAKLLLLLHAMQFRRYVHNTIAPLLYIVW